MNKLTESQQAEVDAIAAGLDLNGIITRQYARLAAHKARCAVIVQSPAIDLGCRDIVAALTEYDV